MGCLGRLSRHLGHFLSPVPGVRGSDPAGPGRGSRFRAGVASCWALGLRPGLRCVGSVGDLVPGSGSAGVSGVSGHRLPCRRMGGGVFGVRGTVPGLEWGLAAGGVGGEWSASWTQAWSGWRGLLGSLAGRLAQAPGAFPCQRDGRRGAGEHLSWRINMGMGEGGGGKIWILLK